MPFHDARTEIGVELYKCSNLARDSKLKVADLDRMRQLCSDALPDDEQLLSAVESFAVMAFESPCQAASELWRFVSKWWRHHFPDDFPPTSSNFHEWQKRADAGFE